MQLLSAIKNPRQIEMHLVEAYLARRALDYLVGFNISPILWTKLPGFKISWKSTICCFKT